MIHRAVVILFAGVLHAQSPLDQALGLALQGDAASAVRVLTQATDLAGEDVEFRGRMIRRFGPAPEPALPAVEDPWIRSLAAAFITYWQRSLTRADERPAAERDLDQQITQLLCHRPVDADAAETEIRSEARKRGFHTLLGRTQPLRELMLWRKQTVERRQVRLPESQEIVTVTYLDDFLLRGWGHYATCGRRSAGGWATGEGLFAVVPAYKNLNDETFLVRFIAHESQHYADKRRFPNLDSWELEYRAKLAELALAVESQASTLRLICENRGASKDSPHGYANSRIVAELGRRLMASSAEICSGHSPADIRAAARSALLEDSRRRDPPVPPSIIQ
jgi:hypothetical protein